MNLSLKKVTFLTFLFLLAFTSSNSWGRACSEGFQDANDIEIKTYCQKYFSDLYLRQCIRNNSEMRVKRDEFGRAVQVKMKIVPMNVPWEFERSFCGDKESGCRNVQVTKFSSKCVPKKAVYYTNDNQNSPSRKFSLGGLNEKESFCEYFFAGNNSPPVSNSNVDQFIESCETLNSNLNCSDRALSAPQWFSFDVERPNRDDSVSLCESKKDDFLRIYPDHGDHFDTICPSLVRYEDNELITPALGDLGEAIESSSKDLSDLNFLYSRCTVPVREPSAQVRTPDQREFAVPLIEEAEEAQIDSDITYRLGEYEYARDEDDLCRVLTRDRDKEDHPSNWEPYIRYHEDGNEGETGVDGSVTR